MRGVQSIFEQPYGRWIGPAMPGAGDRPVTMAPARQMAARQQPEHAPRSLRLVEEEKCGLASGIE
ncbi:MAG: hypothetical protein OXC68_01020 [Aestuariivita sp.]|nr:hypothetical protein [Aestuariivita sp.]